MKPSRLNETMQAVDFGTIDVAVLTGVTQRTVQMWLAGTSPIPQAAALLIEAFAEKQISMEWVEDKIIKLMKTA